MLISKLICVVVISCTWNTFNLCLVCDSPGHVELFTTLPNIYKPKHYLYNAGKICAFIGLSTLQFCQQYCCPRKIGLYIAMYCLFDLLSFLLLILMGSVTKQKQPKACCFKWQGGRITNKRGYLIKK